ncbi:MAG TPA: hypothetical protein PLL30_06325 [Candidatus Krumholzibacteria bacterium]|nr:hypothetical protein [Candidatus Krumholzibacteria bacterium]HPD71381.1 hypothetical protein [Candidatus Krumholzibacteria bacterium]HRY38919.1 hypothetical protein [Candidatus Krumholzibacteria bacterium]
MKRLLTLALALLVAGGVMAQDNFGMYRLVGGEYLDYIPMEECDAGTALDLIVTLHNPTSFSIGGFEVGIDMPSQLFVLNGVFPNGGTNFGGSFTNLLVGYMTPIPVQTDIITLVTLNCLIGSTPPEALYVVYHGANPPSIPGHDGPVYADGVNPDILVPCGYINGTPNVFLFGGVVAVENQTWTGVKNLFD